MMKFAGFFFLFPLELHAAQSVPPIETGGMLQMFLGLIVVLAILLGTAWALKRFSLQQKGSERTLRVIASTSVGPRERVVLVEIGETWLVLGVAAGGVTALHTLPKSDFLPIETDPPAANFQSWLKQVIEMRNVR